MPLPPYHSYPPDRTHLSFPSTGAGMTGQDFYSAVADFNANYWWLRAVLTLAGIWLFIDLARKAPWAQIGLKLVIGITVVGVGILYYGVFLPGISPDALDRLAILGRAVFVVAGLLLIIDAALDRTHLQLPDKGWRLVAVVGFPIIGLGYPAVELLFGHIYPSAQTFGLFPAPLVCFAIPLFAVARPTAWTGHVAFWLLAAGGVGNAVASRAPAHAPIQPLALLAILVGIVMRVTKLPRNTAMSDAG